MFLVMADIVSVGMNHLPIEFFMFVLEIMALMVLIVITTILVPILLLVCQVEVLPILV